METSECWDDQFIRSVNLKTILTEREPPIHQASPHQALYEHYHAYSSQQLGRQILVSSPVYDDAEIKKVRLKGLNVPKVRARS